MENKEIRILVVDDEEDILEILRYNLRKEGYQVRLALDGEHALELAKDFSPHLIILDVMMPDMDGIEVCKRLREDQQFSQTIIAFLTARNEAFTQISALDSGGGDFIAKPIKPNVFKSRVNALLRRLQSHSISDMKPTDQFGDLTIDYDQYSVSVKGRDAGLAKKEFELLALLISKPGKVYKRAEILSKVWGNDVIVGDRTIDVHVRKLREKIGEKYIVTMKGVGYKFDF